jgi:hypothetical protein
MLPGVVPRVSTSRRASLMYTCDDQVGEGAYE